MYCERREEAAAVLKRRIYDGHLPHGAIIPDVRSLDGKQLQELGISALLAGFPCQDISNAGRMAGFSGTRPS